MFNRQYNQIREQVRKDEEEMRKWLAKEERKENRMILGGYNGNGKPDGFEKVYRFFSGLSLEEKEKYFGKDLTERIISFKQEGKLP